MGLWARRNIIKIHNNVVWDWQYFVEYSIIQTECKEYFAEYLSVMMNTTMDLNNVKERLYVQLSQSMCDCKTFIAHMLAQSIV